MSSDDKARPSERWTIEPDGPDGKVWHFYADGNLEPVVVVPEARITELEQERDELAEVAADGNEREKRLEKALESIADGTGAGSVSPEDAPPAFSRSAINSIARSALSEDTP